MEPRDAWISITDAQGRTMHRMPVNQSPVQLVWDTRTVMPGAYQVQLLTAGQRLVTTKLIVQP